MDIGTYLDEEPSRLACACPPQGKRLGVVACRVLQKFLCHVTRHRFLWTVRCCIIRLGMIPEFRFKVEASGICWDAECPPHRYGLTAQGDPAHRCAQSWFAGLRTGLTVGSTLSKEAHRANLCG